MKPWAAVITQHVAHWTAHCDGQNIKWLPRLAYHFTDVHNAARILIDGRILSREQALVQNRMINENAAADVIAETPAIHKRFARLYFRPRTPTQYWSEGIRAPEHRYQQAHCPVPVFFCFDLAELLMQDRVMFSDGSMGRPEVRFGDSLELFQSIPFDWVYHDRVISGTEDKSKIVFHRHAEILVPDQLPLEHLAGVACRTDAERRTLLHLLPSSVRQAWQAKIHRVGDPLFFRDRPHLDSVSSVDNFIRIRINAVPIFGAIPINLEARNTQTGQTWIWRGTHSDLSELAIEFPRETRGRFKVVVRLHGCVAFRGIINIQDDLPF